MWIDKLVAGRGAAHSTLIRVEEHLTEAARAGTSEDELLDKLAEIEEELVETGNLGTIAEDPETSLPGELIPAGSVIRRVSAVLRVPARDGEEFAERLKRARQRVRDWRRTLESAKTAL